MILLVIGCSDDVGTGGQRWMWIRCLHSNVTSYPLWYHIRYDVIPIQPSALSVGDLQTGGSFDSVGSKNSLVLNSTAVRLRLRLRLRLRPSLSHSVCYRTYSGGEAMAHPYPQSWRVPRGMCRPDVGGMLRRAGLQDDRSVCLVSWPSGWYLPCGYPPSPSCGYPPSPYNSPFLRAGGGGRLMNQSRAVRYYRGRYEHVVITPTNYTPGFVAGW